MEERKFPSPANVADAFVKQYFVILDKSPENLHKFYLEPSLLGWPGIDGVVTPVTTLKGINEKVMSSDYKNCLVEVKTTDAQESQDGGILVAVTGCLTGKDDVKKNFCQTFFLAKQANGYYVLNDILRFFDVCTSVTDAAGSSNDRDDQPAPNQNSGPRDACDALTPLDFKAAIQNGKVDEASNLSVSVNNLANGAASTPSIASGEVSVPPAESAKQSVVAPATSAKVPSVVTPAPIAPQKLTYASVLLKMIASIAPRARAVTSNIKKQTVAPSPTPKPSSPHTDVSPKESTPSEGVGISKASTYSSKVTPKSPTGGQGVPSTSAYTDAKGIYIGGLPYGITKQGIVDVVKQFGQVRRQAETVQIRRHDDGFCCGFVDFESADSARRAVEAHHVMFGDKEAYVMYKRIQPNRGNNSRGSPTGGEQRNSSWTGRENNDWSYGTKGRARGPHWSNSSDHQARQAS